MPIITVEGGRLRVMHGECKKCQTLLKPIDDSLPWICNRNRCGEAVRYHCQEYHFWCEAHA